MTAVLTPAPSVDTGITVQRGDLVAARWRRLGLIAAGGAPLCAFAVFFFYPVLSLVGRGFTTAGVLDLSGFGEVLARPRFARILVFTVAQAAGSAALAVGFGIPGAYLLYRCRFRGRTLLRALITVPFVLPTVVVGLAFRSVFADGGPLGSWGWDGSVITVLLAHLFLNYAVVVRMVGGTWALLDRRPEEAARALGARQWRAFATVTLPALGPSIASAAVLVFLFCATSFGIITILGNGSLNTLETEIFRQTTENLDLRTASVLSVVQIVLVTIVLVASSVLRRRTEQTLRIRGGGDRARPLRRTDIAILLPAVAMGALLVGPLIALVTRSLRTADGGWGFGNYVALAGSGNGRLFLVTGWEALGNSVRIALTAAVLAATTGTLLGLVLARRPRTPGPRRAISVLDGVFMLPLGVSAATVGFGFLIALDTPPLDLRTSPLLVPIAQALVATPLVVRMILPTLRGVDDRLRQAAGLLGASPLKVWLTVDLPLMARALAGAGAFAFAVALGEFGATSFLARPDSATLPIVIGRLIARPGAGNAGMAFAAGVVLAALCAVAVLVVDRVGGRDRAAGAMFG